MNAAAEYDQWLKQHVQKAQEDLNPLIVESLLKGDIRNANHQELVMKIAN